MAILYRMEILIVDRGSFQMQRRNRFWGHALCNIQEEIVPREIAHGYRHGVDIVGVLPLRIWHNISRSLLGDLYMIAIVLYGGKHRVIPPLTGTLLLDPTAMVGNFSQRIFVYWLNRKLDLEAIVGLWTNGIPAAFPLTWIKAKWR